MPYFLLLRSKEGQTVLVEYYLSAAFDWFIIKPSLIESYQPSPFTPSLLLSFNASKPTGDFALCVMESYQRPHSRYHTLQQDEIVEVKHGKHQIEY